MISCFALVSNALCSVMMDILNDGQLHATPGCHYLSLDASYLAPRQQYKVRSVQRHVRYSPSALCSFFQH